MVYKLLDTVFNGGDIRSELGMRVDASRPQGADQALRDLSIMPDSVSESQYWAEEEKTGKLAMTALLVSSFVKSRALQRSSALKIRGALYQDRASQIRSAGTMAQQDLRHQELAISHNIMMGGQQRRMTGYAAAAAGARTLI